MHCLILKAKVLLKHQILKIHLSIITSDNFIINKILLRYKQEKEEEEQQYFHYKSTVWNAKSDSKVIPHITYTSFLLYIDQTWKPPAKE